METHTALQLCKLNNEFYRAHAASFSETRTAPWHGWTTCAELIEATVLEMSHEDCSAAPPNAQHTELQLKVLDLACGNLRFESFLYSRLSSVPFSFFAVDNCIDLVPELSTHPHVSLDFQNLDVLDVLAQGANINEQLEAPTCDLAVSFGFMHHIPSKAWRMQTLQSLIRQTRTGGLVLVSFWQFLKSDELRKKALVTHCTALEELGLPSLEANDYLLGWQNTPGVYRYCHSFTEEEIDDFTNAVKDDATLLARFSADGKTGNLNTYLAFKVL